MNFNQATRLMYPSKDGWDWLFYLTSEKAEFPEYLCGLSFEPDPFPYTHHTWGTLRGKCCCAHCKREDRIRAMEARIYRDELDRALEY